MLLSLVVIVINIIVIIISIVIALNSITIIIITIINDSTIIININIIIDNAIIIILIIFIISPIPDRAGWVGLREHRRNTHQGPALFHGRLFGQKGQYFEAKHNLKK